jgi:methylmalonyl-CoA mutase cobalamin-binding subunit
VNSVDKAHLTSEVVVLNRDLLFGSRIWSALKTIGLTVTLVPDSSAFAARIAASAQDIALAIIDLNGEVDWKVIEPVLRDEHLGVPVLAFGPHVDAEKLRAAKAHGVTRVVSNGQFHQDLVSLVQRYRRSQTSE